jgi:hypothetical protein
MVALLKCDEGDQHISFHRILIESSVLECQMNSFYNLMNIILNTRLLNVATLKMANYFVFHGSMSKPLKIDLFQT